MSKNIKRKRTDAIAVAMLNKNLHRLCSGCNNEKDEVERYVYDGLCCPCADKASNDVAFHREAIRQNRKINARLAC